MTTSNICMNSSSVIRLSQTQQENQEKCEWMEHPKYEREWTLGKEEKLETKYEKLTRKNETVTKDVKQTFFGRDNNRIGDWFPYSAIQTLSKWSQPYSETIDYGTKLTNSCKSSGLRNHVGSLASYTDYAYSGPRASRDGGLTKGSGMQNREDKLFLGTGKNQYGLTSEGGTNGGGKRVKEADHYAKDTSQRSPFSQTEIKKKFGSAAKDISQTVISDFISESLCSIIDSSREKGLQNTDISKILTNTLCSSMHTLKDEILTEATSLFLEWLPMAVTQLKCVEGPLQNFFFILEILSKIKDFLEGRLTLWQLVELLLSKAVSLGILYFIACIFGPVGCVSATAISVAIQVTKHLFKCFI